MTDIFDPKKRSEVMASIRAKNTKPEMIAFRFLNKEGVYYRKHYRAKEGIVLDIAKPRARKAVFIDGDFWHSRNIEKLLARKGEDDFWVKKIHRNIERDKAQEALLIDAGWEILRIWTSEIMLKRTRTETLNRLIKFLIDQ